MWRRAGSKPLHQEWPVRIFPSRGDGTMRRAFINHPEQPDLLFNFVLHKATLRSGAPVSERDDYRWCCFLDLHFLWITLRYASPRAEKDHEYTNNIAALGIGITDWFAFFLWVWREGRFTRRRQVSPTAKHHGRNHPLRRAVRPVQKDSHHERRQGIPILEDCAESVE